MTMFMPPYSAFTQYTPALPQFYWNVYSAEQRIKHICFEIDKIINYADSLSVQLNVTHDDVAELQQEFEKFKESGFFDYYAAQIEQWIRDNFNEIMKQILNQGIFFGLTEDGYFCANVAYQLTFVLDTIANYSDENYGRLTITY
nr:MAG TPA: hypothetical protein [Bacteriophage sp.]